MMPTVRKRSLYIRSGMTGVKIPRHVGTWNLVATYPATEPNGEEVNLCVMKHERFEKANRMLVTHTGRVIYVIMPSNWKEKLQEKGWKFR